jgi:hypothetical protein
MGGGRKRIVAGDVEYKSSKLKAERSKAGD